MKREFEIWLLVFIALLASLIIFGGCSSIAGVLDRNERDTQDCILRGGHARLGPGNTILCEPTI